MARKRGLRPPPAGAPEIVCDIWLATGPGRAWKWGRWAKSIKPGDPRRPLAEDVRRRVAEIMVLYRKRDGSRASVLLERLRAVIAATELHRYRGGKPRGAVLESPRILAALRQQYPEEPAKQFWRRLEADERFKRIDAETIICKADLRPLKARGFSSLLSKLSKLQID